MFDYYDRIQGIIRSADSSQEKAQAFLAILTDIKNKCGDKIKLSPEGQFYSTDPNDSIAGEIAEHLKESIVASGYGDIDQYKRDIMNYFNGNSALTADNLINLFDFALLEDKGSQYDKTAIKKIYKNWGLKNIHLGEEKVKWDLLVGDNYLDQADAISSDMVSIQGDGTTIYGQGNVYDTNHTLTDQEVRSLTWNAIAKENNTTLADAVKDHYVGIVGGAHLNGTSEGKQLYENIMIEALANVKSTGKPSFISVSQNGHWSTVSIMPNPSKPGELAITYMDSNLDQKSKRVAEDLKAFIGKNAALGFTVNPADVVDLSRMQQVNNCCGLAAAMNNASIARFHTAVSEISEENPSQKIDMAVMLQSFKEVESSYLFKPEIIHGAGDHESIQRRSEYVKRAGQREFNDLEKMVNHFDGRGHGVEPRDLLANFEGIRDRGFDSSKQSEYRADLNAAYNGLSTLKSKGVDISSKDTERQDKIYGLAQEIGENMSKKIFKGAHSKENKEAVVKHLKEFVLPTLSDNELKQSSANIEKVVGKVIQANDSGWARKIVQDRGHDGLAQYYSDHAMSPPGSGELSQKKLNQLEPHEINSIISHSLSGQGQIMSRL